MAAVASATLWLVRHAPVLAPAGLCYGASDLPADADATRAAAESLASQLPQAMAVRTSPLERCLQLARELQDQLPDLNLQVDERLQELNFGAWEGRLWSAIGRAEFDRWLGDFADVPPSAGGETVRAMMTRVGQAWDDWQASGVDQLWITHAGVMRAASLLARGQRLPASAADWPALDLPFGGLMRLTAP